jgi:hypothetical protein
MLRIRSPIAEIFPETRERNPIESVTRHDRYRSKSVRQKRRTILFAFEFECKAFESIRIRTRAKRSHSIQISFGSVVAFEFDHRKMMPPKKCPYTEVGICGPRFARRAERARFFFHFVSFFMHFWMFFVYFLTGNHGKFWKWPTDFHTRARFGRTHALSSSDSTRTSVAWRIHAARFSARAF